MVTVRDKLMQDKMSSRERVIHALDHRQPDRVPFSWGFCATSEMSRILSDYLAEKGLDWGKLRQTTGDVAPIGPKYIGPEPVDGNLFTGIWGINLKTADYGAGEYSEFTEYPLAGIEDPSVLADYPWPDPSAYDYESLRSDAMKTNSSGEKAVKFFAGNPFEIYTWMTGIEEALINLLVNPDLVRSALGYITEFMETRLRNVLESAGDMVDIVFFADDLGSQTGLLMSIETYENLLKPFHMRLTETVRAYAPQARTMLHSDGAVFDILPSLIDAGFDVLEAVQTDATGMDPGRLKETYGSRLSFHGAISVQQLLPNADVGTVKNECRRLVDILGAGGGYIAAPSHAIQTGTPPENVMAMLEAVLGDEDYQNACEAAVVKR